MQIPIVLPCGAGFLVKDWCAYDVRYYSLVRQIIMCVLYMAPDKLVRRNSSGYRHCVLSSAALQMGRFAPEI